MAQPVEPQVLAVHQTTLTWKQTSSRSTLANHWCGRMDTMMDFRVFILNEVLQTLKLKNFKFKMGL